MTPRTPLLLAAAIATAGCTATLTTSDQPVVQSTCNGMTPSPVPDLHRAAATVCTLSAIADGGLPSCQTNADCASAQNGSQLLMNCVHGQCTYDDCLVDSDCPNNAACVCNGTFYGGLGYAGNHCIPGQCRLDSDCGPGGYCSPSIGRCGSYQGYYCHTARDICVDSTKDCAGCGNSCTYMPTVGAFVCATDVCGG
jgi:hypothetical protein